MSQLADQNTPAHLEGAPPITGHRALSALTTVTLLALLGNALAYTVYLLFALLFSGDLLGGVSHTGGTSWLTVSRSSSQRFW